MRPFPIPCLVLTEIFGIYSREQGRATMGRPKNLGLRVLYSAAADALRENEREVTIANIAAHTERNHRAVRVFFKRNPDLAKEYGVHTIRHWTEDDYIEVVCELRKHHIKPTAKTVSMALSVSRSIASRVLSRIKSKNGGQIPLRQSADQSTPVLENAS